MKILLRGKSYEMCGGLQSTWVFFSACNMDHVSVTNRSDSKSTPPSMVEFRKLLEGSADRKCGDVRGFAGKTARD